MRYNVARGEMAKKTKKDGTISKVNDVKATYATGNIIETNFGIFTAVKAEQRIHIAKSGKQYKVWFVTLKDAQGNTFTIKHQQCKNKNMPKGTVINRPVIAGLLPAPKELIDQLADIVRPMGEQLTYDLLIKQNGDSLKMKISAIALILSMYCDDSAICKKIYRDLCFYYHPDRNTQDTTDIYQHIQSSFEQWLNTK